MIAITVSENIPDAKIENCFGKSEYFFIFDGRTNKSYFEKNSAKGLVKNAGKEAASFLIKKGVKTIFSSNFGVPVKKMLDKAKVQMVIFSPEIKTLKDIKWIKK